MQIINHSNKHLEYTSNYFRLCDIQEKSRFDWKAIKWNFDKNCQ